MILNAKLDALECCAGEGCREAERLVVKESGGARVSLRVLLASQESSYVNGETLGVAGCSPLP